jgi:hypothetical protein
MEMEVKYGLPRLSPIVNYQAKPIANTQMRRHVLSFEQ